MIHEALGLLRRELVTYLSSHGYTTAEDIVVIENIGLFESAASGVNLDDKIVFTLVNIEEESTLKNSAFIKKAFSNPAQYENPPVYLNLYLLVTACNKSADNNSYTDALERLSLVIAFFQSKNSFSAGGSISGSTTSFTGEDLLELTIRHEMYTLSFEQVNHLWGTLGGKQMPFVLYKLRLIAVTERKVLREVPLIEEIETNFSKIPAGH
ncbi:DUF4255 domain-containing protein [Agriterribacter sp.]|uniref:DUF4255 domain-containing protein n=1 Tax=Agriterribacter sp. TaxID=2821509 RepID=UPI002B67A905|nr:DUF4255 domain-containing protein [Agriterribacter sp.]HTN06779.1 DUF4255 domain-containing protein [Agriterribacter sp.]